MRARAAIIRLHHKLLPILLLLGATLLPSTAKAEDGSAAWLRYAPISHPELYKDLPSRIMTQTWRSPAQRPGNSMEMTAAEELRKGLTSMLGREFQVVPYDFKYQASAIRLNFGSRPNLNAQAGPYLGRAIDWYEITHRPGLQGGSYILQSGVDQGHLYAAFHLLELVASERPIPDFDYQSPAAPIRWTDEWDNLNGTIERGYAGPSIFFENGHVRQDLTRAGQYARLLSSIGINGANINNVNADLDTLSPEHLHEFARVAEAFRPWGVKLALSIDLTSPQVVGKLPSFDPLDPTVIAWWQSKVDEIYALIPDFGGFTVKADSEGRKGPSQYGRSPADAANVLARALAPHHGVVLYRGFVYNNHLDWHDLKADRARAGVDNFVRYDGEFEPNVIIQIKEGPIDFQAREPVSPLFTALRHTNEAIEVQTSQEYTGQQRHMVWLPSMWKWVLNTDMRLDGDKTPLKHVILASKSSKESGSGHLNGFVSVTNVGLDANWLHHPMAMANLFGFGKLAWNPNADLHDIIDTWTRLTWGNNPRVVQTITQMQLASWSIYEGYTGPNGMGTLTNILGYHFGPGIESAERNGWGQWFRGEKDGIGMDRTVSKGTGYIGQYPPKLAATYENLSTCPDDLLLFFHHVPYDYKLHSGKTLTQSIYDTHYASALAAAQYVPQWMSLKAQIDPERYQQTLDLFTFQAGHALVWRDAINIWFQHISNIPDSLGRVGRDPNRIEAEAIIASGYEPADVQPWETASGGKAVVCHNQAGCSLSTTISKPAGSYNIAIQYFDIWHGASRYTLLLNGTAIAQWVADNTLPPAQFDPHLDGQDSTRFTVQDVDLKPGDNLQLRGVPDLRPELNTQATVAPAAGAVDTQTRIRPDFREFAPVDYMELGPAGTVTPQ